MKTFTGTVVWAMLAMMLLCIGFRAFFVGDDACTIAHDVISWEMAGSILAMLALCGILECDRAQQEDSK